MSPYILPLVVSAEDASASGFVDLNSLVGGGAGAALIGILYYVGRIIVDRTIPSRSDTRANITILLEGLQSMVKVLQDEKEADARRIADRQKRIDELEHESTVSFHQRAEMQAEIIDLRARVAQKDRHIRQLVSMLTQLGAQVESLDTDVIEITLPAESEAIKRAKKKAELVDEM